MTVPDVYTVADGDTLSQVAAKLWADAVAELNGLDSPDEIYADQTLIFPAPTGVLVIRVAAGDTLSQLVAKHLYPWLYAANYGVIGADPNKLQVGTILQVPKVITYRW